MAKKTKDARVQVILECTEQKASGVPGIYNPYLHRVTVHREIK